MTYPAADRVGIVTRDSATGPYVDPPGVDAVAFQTVLVVEDELHIGQVVRDYLRQVGYRVLAARDGQTALAMARHERPDLMILDLMLPGGMDGLEACRRMRQDAGLGGLPIIMLTARTEETNRLIGLELGADDYVTKPFSPREVVPRARAVLRRVNGSVAGQGPISVGDLRIDLRKRSVSIEGKPVALTPTEFDLLAVMARSPGRPFTRGHLLDLVYDVAYEGYDRAVYSHIKNLRRKIEPDPRKPRYVLTVYGVGYRLADTDL
jgi:DNA-binding response OmpR family regulator